jgi:hypothetical protein
MVTFDRNEADLAFDTHSNQSQEMIMFRTSTLLATALLLAAASFATTMAGAEPVSPVETARFCPAGTHEGYLGKYCWRNRQGPCPAGTHLGYEDKYCWRNR